MHKRCEMISFLVTLVGGVLLTNSVGAQQITKTSFSCNGRVTGYYADVATGCQIYHMCDGIGRKFSYTCPNATLFQQRMLICDHWYMVNCSRATADYSANLLIGQRDKHFVEDSETIPYSRTPRPDLLEAPSNLTEYNIIYRTKEQNLPPRDFVGTESDDENSSDQQTYFPPSHWSTETKQRAPSKPLGQIDQTNQDSIQRRVSEVQQNEFQRTYESDQNNNYDHRLPDTQENNVESRSQYKDSSSETPQNSKNRGKAINVSSENRNNIIQVNFKSNFKATTPSYPQSVKDTTRNPSDIGLLPPIQSRSQNGGNKETELNLELLPPVLPQQEQNTNNQGNGNVKINFPSNYKATTPVYPSEYELNQSLQEKADQPLVNHQVKVNFRSNFKATTPVYPKSVELTSPNPDAVGILPPYSEANLNSNFDPNFQSNPNAEDIETLPFKESNNKVINYESNFKATTPQYPEYVDATSPDPGEVGILPPNKGSENGNLHAHVNFESNFKATTPVYPQYVDVVSPDPVDVGLSPPKQKVAYKSKFIATTPNYPSFVEATSPNPVDVGLVAPKDTVVNFHSDFRATTPNYPTYVDATSPDPSAAGLLAPQADNLVTVLQPNHNPKVYFINQPPHDYSEGEDDDLQEVPGIRLLNFMKNFKREQWQELRQAFKIPEYDFPLDDATRPSYDSVVNSFEPKKK